MHIPAVPACDSAFRFTRIAGVSTSNHICIELRGYDAEHVNILALDSRVISQIWNKAHDRPKFAHFQRTKAPHGSFTFVIAESASFLVVAAYTHGGRYPTDYEVISPQHHSGKSNPSARVELNIDLGHRNEVYGLPWDPCARSGDSSPCACGLQGDSEGYPTPEDIRTGIPSHTVTTLTPGTFRRTSDTDVTQMNMVLGKNASGNIEDHDGDINVNDDIQVLQAHLQSSCWNYGQFHAGSWHLDYGICRSIFSRMGQHECGKYLLCERQECLAYPPYNTTEWLGSTFGRENHDMCPMGSCTPLLWIAILTLISLWQATFRARADAKPGVHHNFSRKCCRGVEIDNTYRGGWMSTGQVANYPPLGRARRVRYSWFQSRDGSRSDDAGLGQTTRKGARGSDDDFLFKWRSPDESNDSWSSQNKLQQSRIQGQDDQLSSVFEALSQPLLLMNETRSFSMGDCSYVVVTKSCIR